MCQQRQGIEAGAAAERAAELKISKYSCLDDKCVFQPIAVESLGPLNETDSLSLYEGSWEKNLRPVR